MVILCGVDDSVAARKAARAAAALARRAEDDLELLHVQDAFLLDAGVGLDGRVVVPVANQALLDAERNRLVAMLEPLREELERDFRVSVGLRFELGFPDWQLARRATQLGAALVVVGAVGHRKHSTWRLGSIPDRLSQSAPVAVLVVRDGMALERWALEERPMRVVVALGADASSARAVEVATDLARLGPCEIVEAHVYDPAAESRRLGLSLQDENATRLAIEQDLARRLPKRVDTALGEPRFVAVPSHGHVAEVLAALVEKERADLVVVGSRSRGAIERRFLGSVSYGLLGLADSNVLVAREERPAREAHAPAPARSPVAVRRVLVATDLSESGNRAIDYGLGLLSAGGQLTLLHVIQRPVTTDMVPIPNVVRPLAEERRMNRSLAQAELARLVPEPPASVEVLTEVAEATDVPHAILQAAERHDANVIVVARRGRGALAALIGSSARAVAGRSPRPVLLVPEAPEGS